MAHQDFQGSGSRFRRSGTGDRLAEHPDQGGAAVRRAHVHARGIRAAFLVHRDDRPEPESPGRQTLHPVESSGPDQAREVRDGHEEPEPGLQGLDEGPDLLGGGARGGRLAGLPGQEGVAHGDGPGVDHPDPAGIRPRGSRAPPRLQSAGQGARQSQVDRLPCGGQHGVRLAAEGRVRGLAGGQGDSGRALAGVEILGGKAVPVQVVHPVHHDGQGNPLHPQGKALLLGEVAGGVHEHGAAGRIGRQAALELHVVRLLARNRGESLQDPEGPGGGIGVEVDLGLPGGSGHDDRIPQALEAATDRLEVQGRTLQEALGAEPEGRGLAVRQRGLDVGFFVGLGESFRGAVPEFPEPAVGDVVDDALQDVDPAQGAGVHDPGLLQFR